MDTNGNRRILLVWNTQLLLWNFFTTIGTLDGFTGYDTRKPYLGYWSHKKASKRIRSISQFQLKDDTPPDRQKLIFLLEEKIRLEKTMCVHRVVKNIYCILCIFFQIPVRYVMLLRYILLWSQSNTYNRPKELFIAVHTDVWLINDVMYRCLYSVLVLNIYARIWPNSIIKDYCS